MKIRIQPIVEVLFLIFFLLLVNIRALVFWDLYPRTDLFSGDAWTEVQIWLLVMLSMTYLISRQKVRKQYVDGWLSHPLLLVFVLFVLISILWSAIPLETLYRASAFLFATAASVYIGIRYSKEQFLEILFWFGCAVIFLSLLTVTFLPAFGTMLNAPYNGAWRGIFWHKNHLGNLLPLFNLIFLIQTLNWISSSVKWKAFVGFLPYLLSLLMLWRSASASGYIVLIILYAAFLIAVLWMRYASRLRPVHYYAAGGALLLSGVLTLLNLDLVLGIFNRSSSFTGRVPLWSYLIGNNILARPWLGNGFGATWSDPAFRIHLRDVLGWGYPVLIGDNGFMDIALNLGLVGLILFLALYIEGWVQAIQGFLSKRSLLLLFPLLFMLYTLFANLTFSLFFETETLVWSVFVVLLINGKIINEANERAV